MTTDKPTAPVPKTAAPARPSAVVTPQLYLHRVKNATGQALPVVLIGDGGALIEVVLPPYGSSQPVKKESIAKRTHDLVAQGRAHILNA